MLVDTYDTDWLLAQVRARASAPTAKAAGADDASILRLANDEQLVLQAMLAKLRKEHLVTVVDIPIVAGRADYPIPPRARGVKAREVGLVVDGKFRDLKLIQIDQLDGYGNQSGVPSHFYFQDSDVVLVPTPATSGTLRMPIYRRPSQLVPTNTVAKVLSVNISIHTITFQAAPPAGFSSTVSYDIMKGSPHYKVLAMDQTGSLSGNVLTTTYEPPRDVALHDYVTLAEQTPVPQWPVEAMPLLAQLTANTLRRNLGMKTDAGEAAAKAMAGALVDILSPRVDGEVETYANRTFFPGCT